MDTGALAFVDCLGWKGIWKHHEPELVLEQLRHAQAHAAAKWAKVAPAVPGLTLQTVFISDTIVVGAATPGGTDATLGARGLVITAATVLALEIAMELLDGTPPIAVRGCVTYGKFLLDGNHIIGQAVDDAASAHERANGAFIWLHPDLTPAVTAFRADMAHFYATRSPEDLLEDYSGYGRRTGGDAWFEALDEAGKLKRMKEFAARQSGSLEEDLLEYDVPLKGGDVLRCLVANPLSKARDPNSRMTRYSIAMDRPELDVVVKRQNTFRFLEHCLAYSGRRQAAA